ncbi:MAG: O-antigen ligase family protein [Acidobacteriota bacterium]
MIRHSGASSALCSSILAAILFLGPLPFGGVLPRDRAALQVSAFIAFALALYAHRQLVHLRLAQWPLLAVSGVALIGFLQSLSWPAFITQVLSPRLAGLWRDAGQLVDPDRGEAFLLPLSMSPAVSQQVALHWMAIAACLAAACLQGRERGARRVLVVTLVLSGMAQIAYGADRWLSRRSEIWSVDVPGEPGRLRGTFVNPDHFALFAAIGMTCAAAWLLWAARRALEGKEAFENRLWRLALPVIAFSLLFVGIAFSGSRAGLLAAVGALTCQGVIVARRHRRWQMMALALAPLALGLGGLAAFGWQRGLARWLETSIYDVTWNARIFAWISSLELWWTSPVTGTGLGTFRQAFPLVQPESLKGTWHHAHSDIIELLVTVGVVGWVLLPLALWALYSRLFKVHRRGRRSEDRAGALGVLGASTAALLHSFLDFGLTIPANAFALAIVVGLALGTPTLESRTRKTTGLTVFMDRDKDATPLGEVSEKAQRGGGSG